MRMRKTNSEHTLIKMQRLKVLGRKLKKGIPPSDEELDFLAQALIDIGNGKSPHTSLNIESSGGWHSRVNREEQDRQNRITFALGWIHQAMQPEPEGLGFNLTEAVAAISSDDQGGTPRAFGFTEEYLKKLWNRHKASFEYPFPILDLDLSE